MTTGIFACDKNSGIGYEGIMPWHYSSDLKRFKKITMGKTCLVGRKTFELMPELPGRTIIVVSRTTLKGRLTMPIDSARNFLQRNPDTFVIGGAQLFTELEEVIDTWHITEIRSEFTCDTFYYPDLNEFSLTYAGSEIDRQGVLDFYTYRRN